MCKECPESVSDVRGCKDLVVGYLALDCLCVNPATYRFWILAESEFRCEQPPQYDGRTWLRGVCAKNTVYLDYRDVHVADLFPILCKKVATPPDDKTASIEIYWTDSRELHALFIETKATIKEDLQDQD